MFSGRILVGLELTRQLQMLTPGASENKDGQQQAQPAQ